MLIGMARAEYCSDQEIHSVTFRQTGVNKSANLIRYGQPVSLINPWQDRMSK